MRYLIDHWKEIKNKYNGEPFGIGLTFYDQQPDVEFPEEVVKPIKAWSSEPKAIPRTRIYLTKL